MRNTVRMRLPEKLPANGLDLLEFSLRQAGDAIDRAAFISEALRDPDQSFHKIVGAGERLFHGTGSVERFLVGRSHHT
jgi:hypothetical protein